MGCYSGPVAVVRATMRGRPPSTGSGRRWSSPPSGDGPLLQVVPSFNWIWAAVLSSKRRRWLTSGGGCAGMAALFRAGCEMWSVGTPGRAHAWIVFTNLRWPKVGCRRLKLPMTAQQRPM
jgi:hypothetical protein